MMTSVVNNPWPMFETQTNNLKLVMYKDVGFRNIASYLCSKVPLHHCFSLIRFKDVDPGVETHMLSTSDPEKNRTFSIGSKPCKKISRQRMNTFSHCQYYTIKGKNDVTENV